MAHLLGAQALRVELPTGTLFESITLGVDQGDRIGIVGRNGGGKTTLLQLLAGLRTPDSGRVTSRRDTTVGFLSQVDDLDLEATARRTVVGGTAGHEWARDPKTREILDALASGIDREARVGSLSGGQRRRLGLARVLVADADILLLDEPTNHLDIQAIAWLAGYLVRRRPNGSGAVLVVSHDRWFLDEVATSTWEVHDCGVEPFEGGYAAYVLQKVERDRMAAVVERKRQNLMRKELAWLRRGPPARTTKAKFRVNAANELIQDEPPPRNQTELMRLATSRLGREVVNLDRVTVSRGGREILRDVTWLMKPGERSAIVGVNGAGKTTLFKLITGELAPERGCVTRGRTVRVATLTQEPEELAELGDRTVGAVVKRYRSGLVIGEGTMTPSQLLERVGFRREQLLSPVSKLSGGQRRRLQLLLALLDEPNVLLLDEPTNDLDIDMLTALEDLLDWWPGTLLVASHDRYLVERVTDDQYAIIDGRLRHLPGGIDQYLGLLEERKPGEPNRPAQRTEPAKAGRDGAERHALSRERSSVERRMAKLPAQIERASQDVAAHDQSDYEGLMKLVDALSELKLRESELETRWLELTELLESQGAAEAAPG